MANLDLSILNTLGNDISASEVKKGDVLISSSLLSNAKVMKGDDEVLKVMLGDNKIWELQKVEVIQFEDNTVKNICVNNWGGGVVAGEITPAEAAAVTSLSGKFKANKTITKFNELRYFTGLTTLNNQFYNCTNLIEVTIPAANIADFTKAFQASGIKKLDIRPTLVTTNICIYYMASYTPVEEVYLKAGSYGGTSPINAFYAGSVSAGKLKSIHFDNTVNLNTYTSNSAYSGIFNNQSLLTTITGKISNIRGASLKFSASPLTLDSILVVLDGLKSNTTQTLTLRATSGTYTNPIEGVTEYESIATNKGWTIAYV